MGIPYVFHDGGREVAGFRGKARDCVTRAIAIATERPYLEIFNTMTEGQASVRRTKRRKTRRKNAGGGVWTDVKWFQRYMETLGWMWTPTMGIEKGCRVHLRASELPKGRLIVRVSGHMAAVIDGVLFDSHDCSRRGNRCVYGYWQRRTETIPLSNAA